jgi:hypothetical protein
VIPRGAIEIGEGATVRRMKASTVKRTGVPTWQLLKLAGEAKLDPQP